MIGLKLSHWFCCFVLFPSGQGLCLYAGMLSIHKTPHKILVFEWRQINYANWVSFSDTTQDWNGQKRRHVWATTGDGSAPCSADVTHWSANSSLSWICTSNIRTALWTTLWLSTAAPPRLPRSRLSSIQLPTPCLSTIWLRLSKVIFSLR